MNGYYVDEGMGNHLIMYYSEKENKVIAVPIERRNLCQYSGRNDRAGVEIYERDRWETYGVVSFEDGKFMFNWENITEDLFEIEDDSEVKENTFD
ncbi:YopX family protein [Enterococcus sp. BWB1-3]|uniref:YopX family protein n=1 Tax=Enterococcus sp. BWB1-3 TaxID=2787713 RepID=UPI002ED0C971